MTYHGRVCNGQILLDGSAELPEGAEVDVAIVNGGSGRLVRQRRARRVRLDPDVVKAIASLPEFHPDEA